MLVNGGQFMPVLGGQFKPVLGGQFAWIFQIVEKMEQVYDFGLEFPALAQRRLRSAIRFAKTEL